ncbi:MAG: hypothetical protein PHX52_01230 [Candidatus Pacebacteria bacterium]|nr:hypothetical protein [Candidatus Paceibacterota bacterium]MDD3919188.1 hypothetical protein [Candidatus Paceibacterota bacterium]
MKKNIILLIMIIVFGAVCFYLGNTFDLAETKNYYIEQGYSFKAPNGWTETNELGTTAFLNEAEDNGDNPFKSYIFFVKDSLLGRTSEQYFEYIKRNIEENSESVEILEEKDEGSFHIIYLKTVQGEVGYIVAMAFLPGANDTYSIVSLNTLEAELETTRPVFEETYRSFSLR